MHIANYHQERDTLTGALGEWPLASTIFVSGGPDYGKTWLLRWFQEQYSSAARIVHVDLADPEIETTPVLAMNMCARKLGWHHFNEYKDELARRPANQAKIENVRVYGDNATFTANAGPEPPDQVATAIELTAPFVKGVASAAEGGAPIVICLDGYCSAQATTRSWIERALAGDLAASRCARLIIAGRKPASPKLCDGVAAMVAIELRGVDDVNEWERLANELGRTLPGENDSAARLILQGAILISEAAPGKLMRWLKQQPPRVEA